MRFFKKGVLKITNAFVRLLKLQAPIGSNLVSKKDIITNDKKYALFYFLCDCVRKALLALLVQTIRK